MNLTNTMLCAAAVLVSACGLPEDPTITREQAALAAQEVSCQANTTQAACVGACRWGTRDGDDTPSCHAREQGNGGGGGDTGNNSGGGDTGNGDTGEGGNHSGGGDTGEGGNNSGGGDSGNKGGG